ncbi:MAG: cobalamin B12-binding domain-containing protein [Promethearchaeota archaeon]
MTNKNLILCATLGSCVHVAGVFNFMQIAQQHGYKLTFLRPPNTIEDIITEIEKLDPEIIALSYRLTPKACIELVKELNNRITPEIRKKKWIFGGTSPVCNVIKQLGVFDQLFGGNTTEKDVIEYLRKYSSSSEEKKSFPTSLIDRIKFYYPYPLLRAHYGVPSVEETQKGIKTIATAKIIDIISIGPDQNFQEHFFDPKKMKKPEQGAGGVPIRSEEDLIGCYKASKRGNYPLLRCYSGTRNLINMARMLKNTINNAWGATPLFWYSELDGRSGRLLPEAIKENISNMVWHGKHNIPFETNEAHHWSLRSAPDVVAVAAAFLGAYNAKKAGVQNYISQMMFNTPIGLAPRYDLAKMLAKTELIEGLHSDTFTTYRQIRTGLMSFPEDPHLAKGQLASSIQMAMFIKPHIVHVVSYCEAEHAATSEDVIESAKIARKVISNSLRGLPSINHDPKLDTYKSKLKSECYLILQALRNIAGRSVKDPFIHPPTLARAVELGIFDAPHLKGSKVACGKIHTSIIDGKCLAIDPNSFTSLPELDRLNRILEENGHPLLKKELEYYGTKQATSFVL